MAMFIFLLYYGIAQGVPINKTTLAFHYIYVHVNIYIYAEYVCLKNINTK